MSSSKSLEAISIWIVEDHPDYRTIVERVINQIPGMRCPHGFASCERALAALAVEPHPRIILMDVALPGMNGIAGIKEIKALAPDIHVIVLTVYDDHEKVFEAICAGASGYLLKSSPEESIANGIQEVLQGGAPINPRVARLVLNMFNGMAARPQSDYGLSEREHEVLDLMVKGLIKKEIAGQLNLSYHTVDSHLRNIYTKLQVHTCSAAVVKAIKERLIKPGQPPSVSAHIESSPLKSRDDVIPKGALLCIIPRESERVPLYASPPRG